MELELGGDDPHRACSFSQCSFPGFEAAGGGKYVTLPSGKEVFYPGCPQRHFSRQLNEWLSGYRWLKMGKTPVELGLVEPHEMDPRWYDAMELIDSEINRLQAAAYKDK